MFLEAIPEYTETEINFKKQNPIINKNKKIINYSNSVIFVDYMKNETKLNYFSNTNSVLPAPKKLKKAMFKMSSKGIGKILNNA